MYESYKNDTDNATKIIIYGHGNFWGLQYSSGATLRREQILSNIAGNTEDNKIIHLPEKLVRFLVNNDININQYRSKKLVPTNYYDKNVYVIPLSEYFKGMITFYPRRK